MGDRWLVPEIGLRDNRRGRRWLALFRALDDLSVGPQEVVESTAWAALRALENDGRRARRRRELLEDAVRPLVRHQDVAQVADALESSYADTR